MWLPAQADRPLHVARADDPQASLDIEDLGARPVAGSTDGRVVHMVERSPGVDALYFAEPGRVESLHHLAAAARAPLRFRLRRGSSVASIRLLGNRLVATDALGTPRLESEEVVAYQADGRRVPLALDLVDDVLTVRIETPDGTPLKGELVVDPAWVASSNLPTVKTYLRSATTVLTTGKVLVAAGAEGTVTPYTATTAVWDPSTGAWSSAGTLATARRFNTLTAVSGGRALVVAGAISTGRTGSAELWDGGTTWSSAGAIAARANHAAVYLSTNKVLVVGGSDTSVLTNADLYDVASGTWSATGALAVGRYNHSLTVLGDGRVLAVGGQGTGGTYLASAEIWNGSTWASAGTMATARALHAATLVGGKVLVTGGRGSTAAFSSAELYDPALGTWKTLTATMAVVRAEHGSITLPGGLALVVGGGDDASLTSVSANAELFDPITETFRTAGSMTVPRARFGLVALADGRALAVGGFGGGTTFHASSELYQPKGLGASCAVGTDCLSGFCVDSVCCNTSCTEQCKACNLAGVAGTCSAVDKLAPVGARPACGTGYVCKAGACATSCSGVDDTVCQPGYFCNGTACQAKQAKGASCSRAAACSSGQCVDGRCCDSACTGQCEACDVAGALGTCTPVAGAPHGARSACVGVTGSPCGITCDGAVDRTKCTYPSSVACGSASCAAGIATFAGTCNGAGGCNKPADKDCGGFACDATTCKATCSSPSDCKAGFTCSAGACTPPAGKGLPCKTTSECGSLFCVDDVCCLTSSCGAGEACNTAADKGACKKSNGTACTSSAQCGSGQCVDGVCCDSACEKQCEACDVPGSVGICSGVSGAPRGSRAPCAVGADVCGARVCDGLADRATCAAFAKGTETKCGSAKCEGTQWTGSSACDGKGVCVAPTATSCVPYACDIGGCKTSCSGPADCADDASCVEGKCISQPGTCSTDRTVAIARDGKEDKCEPYLCLAGKCERRCTDSNGCQTKYACDAPSGQCLSRDSDPIVDHCAASGPHPSGVAPTSAVIVTAAMLAMTLRRRRRGPGGRS